MNVGPRRPRAVVVGAAVALAVAGTAVGGCAPPPVTGQAVPDWQAVQENQDVRFEAQLDALAASITAADSFTRDVDTDVAGVAYTHATFGEDTLDNQIFVAIHGNPPTLFQQQTDAEAGATLDEIHLPGDQWDYYLLGERFTSLAPTRWVRMPTSYQGQPVNPLGTLCATAGFYHACFLHDMIRLTAESDRGADVRRLVSVSDDGTVHSQTEVTLQALLDTGQVLSFTDELLAQFSDEMRQSLIPVHFWQDADGNLLKMEMNGVFEGDGAAGDLEVQTGFEVTGLGSGVETPALPPEWDITTIDTADGVAAFWDGVWELK